MTDRDQAIAEVFALACEVSGKARDALLDTHCHDEPMRRSVETLLRMDDSHPPGFLRCPLPDGAGDSGRIGEVLGGRYRLEAEIGEGASGVVFRATQIEPIQRAVAVKILKAGMDTRQIIARFETERQTLAMLDHPSLARVLDAGATGTGRPFFVMDLIEGEPLTAYGKTHHLDIKQRLSLMAQVCEAVHHAHTKGVIHRDLKPGNILVHDRDGKPVVRVIDFGIAKVLSEQRPEETLHTLHGQRLGTPAYMSPEQARGEPDIDTRADIYALGAVLYEALTGYRPIDAGTVRGLSNARLEEMICMFDPVRPSVRVVREWAQQNRQDTSEMSGQATVAPPRALEKALRGDLDAIVMMAMAKDRDRRYQSVLELASDLRAVLERRPVQARRPSARYRVSRFIARNKLAVFGAGLFVALLIGATVTTTVLAVSATRSGARADDATTEANQQRATAQAVQLFLEDMLESASELGDNGQNVTMLDVLTATTQRLNAGALTGQPEVEAQVRFALGKSFYGLGRSTQAVEHFRWSLDHWTKTRPPGEDLRLSAMWFYGETLKESTLLEESMSVFKAYHDEALETHGPTDGRVWDALDQVGNTLMRQGKWGEALGYQKQAYDGLVAVYGQGAIETGVALLDLGAVQALLGQMEQAEANMLASISILEQGGALEFASVLRAKNALSLWVYDRQGRDDLAEQTLRGGYESALEQLGASHGETARIGYALGRFLMEHGRLEQAHPYLAGYLSFVKQSAPVHSTERMFARREMAALLVAQHRYEQALSAYLEIETSAERLLADDAQEGLPNRDRIRHYLETAYRGQATSLLGLGKNEMAGNCAHKAVVLTHALDPDNPAAFKRLDAKRLLFYTRIEQGESESLVPDLERLYDIAVPNADAPSRVGLRVMDTLGYALVRAGQTDRGIEMLVRADDGLRNDFGTRTLPRWESSLRRYPELNPHPNDQP